MIQELIHPLNGGTGIKAAGFPVHFSELHAGIGKSAPYPGKHNEEIYRGLLGISQGEMEKLKEDGII